jgi:hypothetical protein
MIEIPKIGLEHHRGAFGFGGSNYAASDLQVAHIKRWKGEVVAKGVIEEQARLINVHR